MKKRASDNEILRTTQIHPSLFFSNILSQLGRKGGILHANFRKVFELWPRLGANMVPQVYPESPWDGPRPEFCGLLKALQKLTFRSILKMFVRMLTDDATCRESGGPTTKERNQTETSTAVQ